ncbi:hypothetical protein Vi05172_g434 [Venturia inaequalis]|nr:hypothetical protein Vi05172_g434 [Venturia inaequalis]
MLLGARESMEMVEGGYKSPQTYTLKVIHEAKILAELNQEAELTLDKPSSTREKGAAVNKKYIPYLCHKMYPTGILLGLAASIILTARIIGVAPMIMPRNKPSESKEDLVIRDDEASTIGTPLLTLDEIKVLGGEGYFPAPIAKTSPVAASLSPRNEAPFGSTGYLPMTFCSTGGQSTCKLLFLLNDGCYADPLLDLPNLKAIRWSKLNAWRCSFYDDMDCAWGRDFYDLYNAGHKVDSETTEDVRKGILAWDKDFVAKSVRCVVTNHLKNIHCDDLCPSAEI